MSHRFGELILKAFSSAKSKLTNDKLRERRLDLKTQREALILKYIDPIDGELLNIQSKLSQGCEHPTALVDVNITGWHDDDGEGNDWSGDTVKIKCASCGLSVSIDSNSDDSHGERFKTEKSVIGKANLNTLWKQVLVEQNEAAQKRQKEWQEEAERKELARLQKKYGKSA